MQFPDQCAPTAEKPLVPKTVSDWFTDQFLITNNAKIAVADGNTLYPQRVEGDVNAGHTYAVTDQEEHPISFRFQLIVCAVRRVSDFQNARTRRSLCFEGERMPIRN